MGIPDIPLVAHSLLAGVARRSTSDQTEVQDVLDQRITNYVGIIGFTILVWDHIITFDDEVKYIWRKPKSLLVYLFLLNRYFTPLSFIVNLTAYFSTWSPEVYVSSRFHGYDLDHSSIPPSSCKKFVRYEGSCTVIAIEVAALMMLLRVKALYSSRRQIWVYYFPAGILATETAVNAWLLSTGQPVSHNTSSVRACTMIFDPALGSVPSLSAWFPLIYDTIVIFMTMYACFSRLSDSDEGHLAHIARTLVKDGLLYYSVIFSINLVLALMIAASPVHAGLKNLTAQLEQLLTVAMMSRITLNLKHEGSRDFNLGDSEEIESHIDSAERPTQHQRDQLRSITSVLYWRESYELRSFKSAPVSPV